MDVEEVLSFRPVIPGQQQNKRRIREPINDASSKEKRSKNSMDKESILEMVDAEPEGEVLDENAVKRLILQFEKRVSKNQEMRIKFPDHPEKFMESEIELNMIIQEMHVIATVPEHYHVLIDLNSCSTMIQLLNHENTDIFIAMVNFLQELTDVDTLTESEEGANNLIDALMDGQVISILVHNLERLDESVKEESDGVYNTLSIIENMTDLRNDVCTDAAQQGLLTWLLKRLKAKIPFETNKLFSSEILSILLQNNEANQQLLGDQDGTDVLLQQLSHYKRHNPSSTEEVEFMENLFNCLCSAMMLDNNREKFLKGEGLQLMILMIREKKLSRLSAIKVLDHAMTGPQGSDNCQKFVDILGLRSIFPLFMKTPKTNKKAGPNHQDMEEHIISIISSMMKNTNGSQRQRLLSKFSENDHEKVDRLVELHFKYFRKLKDVEEKIDKEKQKIKSQGERVDDEMEELFYLRKLENGLFTLQQIDYIMLEICASGTSSIKQRVMQILNMRGGSIKAIRSVMREFAGNIGDSADPDIQQLEQNRILQLIDKF